MPLAKGSHLKSLPPSSNPAQPIYSTIQKEAYQQELFAAYLVSRQATTGPHSLHATHTALKTNLLTWLTQRKLFVWEVTPDLLDQWALSLKNSVKTRTHQNYFGQVQLFFEWLVGRHSQEIYDRLGVRLVNPVDKFNRARRLPENERLVAVPREATINFFLAACRAQIDTAPSDAKWLQACRNYTLWMVLNWAGLRRMEVVTLSRTDIDLVAGTLSVVEGKGGKGRIVQLQPGLAAVLKWYLQEIIPQAPWFRATKLLFVNCRAKPLDPKSVANLLHNQQLLAKVAPEDFFTCHGFRRAFATRLYKALRQQNFRDPLIYVKEQLGHKYLTTTQLYCQLDDDYRYELVQEATMALTQHYGRKRRNNSNDH
jgi:integrase/recombinase XerD